jgi:hypothetical protein
MFVEIERQGVDIGLGKKLFDLFLQQSVILAVSPPADKVRQASCLGSNHLAGLGEECAGSGPQRITVTHARTARQGDGCCG